MVENPRPHSQAAVAHRPRRSVSRLVPLACCGGMMPRVGVGVDVHPFEAGRTLYLAGLLWPGETGLAGHSDGDAAAHAACDVPPSAAGLATLAPTSAPHGRSGGRAGRRPAAGDRPPGRRGGSPRETLRSA